MCPFSEYPQKCNRYSRSATMKSLPKIIKNDRKKGEDDGLPKHNLIVIIDANEGAQASQKNEIERTGWNLREKSVAQQKTLREVIVETSVRIGKRFFKWVGEGCVKAVLEHIHRDAPPDCDSDAPDEESD